MGVQRVTFRFDVDRNVSLILIASHDLPYSTRARISIHLKEYILVEIKCTLFYKNWDCMFGSAFGVHGKEVVTKIWTTSIVLISN